ncbi:MAG: hypothetical protein L6R42_009220, partial [Xanthoria sp. 1 TBL-2021]
TGQEETTVEILKDNITPGENVREIGSDVKAGETVLRKGEEITAVGGELGLLASVGKKEVSVYRKPVVGVLSTGDEIVPHDRPGSLRLGEVRDTNRPTVMAAVRGWGFEVMDLGIATDKQDTLEQSLRDAMRKVDVIVTTGGVSMGELDLLKPTIERRLGGTIQFGRISMKPGKPTTFATVPFKNNAGDMESRLVFSLPGNPASAIVTSHLFVLPSLQHSSGVSPVGLPKVLVTLDHDFRLDPERPEYHRVIITAGSDGLLVATSTGGQRSSRQPLEIPDLVSIHQPTSDDLTPQLLAKAIRDQILLMYGDYGSGVTSTGLLGSVGSTLVYDAFAQTAGSGVSGTIRKAEEEVIRRGRAAILKARRESQYRERAGLDAILGPAKEGMLSKQSKRDEGLESGIEDEEEDDDDEDED